MSLVIPYIGLVLGIIAIILSNKAFKEIKQYNEDGYGMAVAGLTCGIVGTAIYGIIILITLLALFVSSVFYW